MEEKKEEWRQAGRGRGREEWTWDKRKEGKRKKGECQRSMCISVIVALA